MDASFEAPRGHAMRIENKNTCIICIRLAWTVPTKGILEELGNILPFCGTGEQENFNWIPSDYKLRSRE